MRKREIVVYEAKRFRMLTCIVSIVTILLVLYLLPCIQTANAQSTRYVDGTGTSTSNCTNPANPCATISSAILSSVPGDTIEIASGVYTESLNINKSLTIRGAGMEQPGGTIIQAHSNPGQATNKVITVSSGMVVKITDVIVRHGRDIRNEAPWGNGGGLFASNSTITLKNIIFQNNQANFGGGAYLTTSFPTLHNVHFRNNTATISGGGLHNGFSAASISNVSFENNRAEHVNFTNYGGGLYVTASDVMYTPVISNVMFADNTSDIGGGFYVSGHAEISQAELTGNRALKDGGGGALTNGQTVIEDTRFIDNRAEIGGGGLKVINGNTLVKHSEFIENAAVYGGAVRVLSGNPEFFDVRFESNSSSLGGAANNNPGSAPVYMNNLFVNNIASQGGGGVYSNGGSAHIIGSLFYGNTSVMNGGAIQVENTGNLNITNTTIYGNLANNHGGGIRVIGGSVTIRNSLIWGNDAGNGKQISVATTGTATLHYNLLGTSTGDVFNQGGLTCNNCIENEDPLFADAANGDLRILEGSPAIDTGDPNTNSSIYPLNGDEIPIDLSGNPRFHNGQIDLGAYEFQGALTSIVEYSEVPDFFELYQNYPNPFNPSTTIRFNLPEPAQVTLHVYDLLGRRVAVLVDANLQQGENIRVFDVRGLTSGVYVYRLATPQFTAVRKMIIAK